MCHWKETQDFEIQTPKGEILVLGDTKTPKPHKGKIIFINKHGTIDYPICTDTDGEYPISNPQTENKFNGFLTEIRRSAN